MDYHLNGGMALYGAYAADINLDSSALKDAGVDCSSLLRFEPQKSGGMLVLGRTDSTKLMFRPGSVISGY